MAKRPAKPKPKLKPKSKPRAKQNPPSLLGSVFPIGQMAAIGKSAAADIAMLAPRRVAGGKGKGTRKNPIVHRITPRKGKHR